MEQNKKYLTACFAILLFLFHNSFCLAGQDELNTSLCITQLKNGAINWTTGMITATGKASVEDNTKASHKSVPGSARADANRHIIDILKQLIINNSLRVGKYASGNDIIMAGIEKTARDAVITRQYYTSALSVEILIETSMFGGFLQLLLPENIRQIPQINIGNPQKKIVADNFYTGLIIDARKLGIEPVINPVIISEQGDDIYSASFISREFAVQNGVCKYYCNMDQALKDDRIGSHPLIIKGLRNAGKQNTAIIVSMSDYLILEKTTERHTFLKECRVIIVKD